MAQNLPQRERSKRQQQNSKYNDNICEKTMSNRKQSLPCKGCDLVFKNNKALLLHQAGCLTVKVDLSKQPASFFKNQKNQSQNENEKQYSTAEKILPSSQPLGEYKYREDLSPLSYAAIVSSPGNTLYNEKQNQQLPSGTVTETASPSIETARPIAGTVSPAVVENASPIVENCNPVEEVLFIDPTIRPNLPDFIRATSMPNKDYNNIPKAT